MLEFILKYWIEFLFGIIAALILKFGKRVYDNFEETFIHKMDKLDNKMDKIDNKLETNSKITLELFKPSFYGDCQKLINSDFISDEEFDKCKRKYSLYKDIGGNSNGDVLFQEVEKLYQEQLKKGDI